MSHTPSASTSFQSTSRTSRRRSLVRYVGPAVALAVMVAIAPLQAHAQTLPPPGAQLLTPTPQTTSHDKTSQSDGGRDNPWIAFGLPAATTAGFVGLLALTEQSGSDILLGTSIAGILSGPSAGFLYTGDYRRALLVTSGNSLGTALFLVGAWECIDDEGDTCDHGKRETYMIFGAGVVLASTLYGLIGAPHAAAVRRAERQRSFQLLPGPVTGPDGSVGMGLHLGFTLR